MRQQVPKTRVEMSISQPPNYGTPDWQRGVVASQKLLDFVAPGVHSAVVIVPPNAESIVVFGHGLASNATAQCLGITSGVPYVGVSVVGTPGGFGSVTWFFDVSQAVDSEVQVSVTGATPNGYYIYADAGIHLIADAANLRNAGGEQYVIPTVPNVASGDHPPNELQYASAFNTVGGTVLPAPGAGQRYRIFSAEIANYDSAGVWQVRDVQTSGPFLIGAGASAVVMTYGPSGLPLSNNAAVAVLLSAGGGTWFAILVYTLETI